jgi:hypothetical protein
MSEEKIIINTYGSEGSPDAAKFGVGASTLRDVQAAIDARNELSDAQSTAKSGPVRREQ